jgi:FkbM family methyltransferase
MELCCWGDSEEITQQMIGGTHDRFFYEDPAVKQALKDSLCWDVGAHFGYHSLAFASLGGKVVAFEPNAKNAARCKLNLGRNLTLSSRIRLRNEALSDHDGVIEFMQSDDLSGPSSGSHLSDAAKPLAESVYRHFQQVRVPGRRADSLIAEGENAPTVMKIDVEGAELLVLEGARELLQRKKPLLFLEIHHIRLMFFIHPFLEKYGYQLRLLEGADDSPSRCFVIAS